MGQANTSSSPKTAVPTVAGVTVFKVSAENVSKSDSDFEEDDTAPVSSVLTVSITAHGY